MGKPDQDLIGDEDANDWELVNHGEMPDAGVTPVEVSDPVGQLDLAPKKNTLASSLVGVARMAPIDIQYVGTEGELYDLEADPHQRHNLWDDPALRTLRDELVADLYDSLPSEVNDRGVEAVA